MKKWYTENNVLNRAIESFWKCFENYESEEHEEYTTVFPKGKENVKLIFEKFVYEVVSLDFDHEIFSLYLHIFVDDETVGWFKQEYLLDGMAVDEFFVVD